MNIAGFTRGALASLRDSLDSPTFTWRGKSVPCVPSTVGNQAVVALGGFDVQITLTLRVDTREFMSADSTLVTVDSDVYTVDNDTPTPVSGKAITFRGQAYKIATARRSPCKGYISLELIDRNA